MTLFSLIYVLIKLSASSGSNSQGGMLGIGAENFCPDTSNSITVPYGTSSSISILWVKTSPGASSESTRFIFGSK